MNEYHIGLLGLTPISKNLGCEALTFSFLEILNEYSKNTNKKIIIHIIEPLVLRRLFKFKNIKYTKKCKNHLCEITNLRVIINYFRFFMNRTLIFGRKKKFDCIFDFTQGDSFTDIYGQDRFEYWTKLKEYFISKKIPFIIGSQTIGPFTNPENEKRAIDVLKKSYSVFSRDIMTYNYVKNNLLCNSYLTTDIAFFLPYKKSIIIDKAVGFNPSGLLWNGGYTRTNQFGLSVDYREYCKKTIELFLEKGFEVHLIGHVIDEDLSNVDNDLLAINELHNIFPSTIIAPLFKNPIEAKSYISKMSIFIGARMHSTIAAVSSSVPVIPFSYSRKFEGLFETINYESIIHGKDDTLEEAISKTLFFVENQLNVHENMLKTEEIIKEMKGKMLIDYFKVLDELFKD